MLQGSGNFAVAGIAAAVALYDFPALFAAAVRCSAVPACVPAAVTNVLDIFSHHAAVGVSAVAVILLLLSSILFLMFPLLLVSLLLESTL